MAGPTTSVEPVADNERYTLLHALGTGASGSVYLAQDAETGGYVALKKLSRLDQKSVQRFKREFRSLTDLHHPNLVKLFDLQRGSDAWFLTMEYIEGEEFQAHLQRSQDVLATREERLDSTGGELDSKQLALLLRVFHELASGVGALHRAGLLHRDLKPSNVLIARDGRVVVLDFGLVRDLDEQATNVTQDGTVAGTPAYMAPEQALGHTLTEASDWYAFGVMLYEALAGCLPIDERNIARLLERKLGHDAPPLSHKQLGVPRELTELCMQLVRREPAQRPEGSHVLRILSGLRGLKSAGDTTYTTEVSLLPDAELLASKRRAPFVGRAAAVSQLTAALDRTREGHSIAVNVRGSSGAGKTALVEHFLLETERRDSPTRPAPLVLRSRCYERESMPFKALDGAMDALVHYLSKQDDLQVAHLVPSGLVELTQLFPTFQRLRSVQQLLLRKQPHPDAGQTRQRAEHSLRELIDRVSAQRPVVLWIDDLQWGDLDSASVLRDWFGQPGDSPLLLVLSYRSEELATSACLRALGPKLLAADADGSRELIELEALGDKEVTTLCTQRLTSAVPPEVVTRIVREARGNPFWVLQLSALAQAKLGRGELELDDISIGELVVRTTELLPAPARAILDVLAVAGRPLLPHLALRAAHVGSNGRTFIHELQGLRLLRSPVVNGERFLEIYHDRVREAVQSALDPEALQRVHSSLLRVIEMFGRADPDWLHELAMGAGELELALRYGLLAAERAHKSLAFERAIDLYQRCLRLTESGAEQADLWRKLALVLARSRRGAEAADAYLEAAARVAPAEQLPLVQLAASHLLRTGSFDEGEKLVQRVIDALHIDVPKTELGLYAAIGWERTRLALRGSSFERKDPADGSRERTRLSALYGNLSVDTQMYAPLRAALFQARALRLAYESGDALLVARGLCLTAAVSCLAGTPRAAARADEQLTRAEALADELDSQDTRSEVFSARAICAFLLGRPDVVLRTSDLADRIYDTQRSGGEQGDYYYLFAVHVARIGALQIFGDHKQAQQRLLELLAHADATGNRTAVLQATLVHTVSEIMADRKGESRPRLDRERDELPRQGIGILHMLHLAAVVRAACHTFEFDWALDVIGQLWEPCFQSPMRHGRMLRYLLHSARARLLLDRYVMLGRHGDAALAVRDDLRALRAIKHLPIDSLTLGIDARIAYLRGDKAAAILMSRQSLAQSTAKGLLEEAAREKHALGFLIGGDEGAQLRAAAVAESHAIGAVNPLALLRASHTELVIDAGL